ncbi:MAG: septum formation initiator family protein [Deltaproteobacteria bacterium]|jgi:cell division protein FtsB|nr:septum formation initiator family protein [Deltaproteobacteria bacterium]
MRAALSSPLRRRWAGRIVLAIVCAALLASLPTSSGDGEGSETAGMALELAEVRTSIDDRQRDNRILLRKITALKNDPRAIERAARDELGMVHEGELILRFATAEKADHR